MKFQFIASYQGSLSRSHLCRMMGVTDRGLRAWLRRPPSIRQRRDMVILAHIREQHRLSLGSYGRPRMTEELNGLGLQVGQRRVGRLMRQNGIRIIRSRKFKRTTDSDHAFNIAPNLLQQDFSASAPNQKWAGDITYIWTREGWVYLAVILDLFSRRVIGWAISNRMKQDLAIRALNMAVALRRPPPGCLHHTDRGSQYCAHDYQKILRKNGFKVSMSGRGNCYDNSAVEPRRFSRTSGVHRLDLQVAESRTGLAPRLAHPARRRNRPLRIHQWLLQPAPETLDTGMEITRGLRTEGRLT